jgi:hypothetical protein
MLALCRYAGGMTNRFNALGLSIITISLAAAIPALANEKRNAPQTLPGVEYGYRIVKPMVPEPETEPSSAIKVDGWEVSVTSTVTVDITTGNLPLPRH